jgi:hypothetical protein
LSRKVLNSEIIPENVINVEAYQLLVTAEKELQDSPDRFYHCKTADVIIDCLTGWTGVNHAIKINKVADYEAALVMEITKKFISKWGKLNKLRWNAFKGERGLNKFNVLDPKKAELIAVFGKYNTVAEAHKIVTTNWNLDVSYATIERFRLENLEIIQSEQDKYVKDWSGLKLVYKKSRLDEYSGLYEDRKIRYEETHHRDDYRLLLQTLEAIRKEIEGDRLTVDGSVELNVQQTISIHVQQDILRNLNILEFIIARVAVRMGKSTSFLMERLEKSYYSKFTGIIQPDNNRDTDEIFYPSRELYDFNKIKTANEALSIQDVQPIVEVKPEIKQAGNALLQALMKRKRSIIESEKVILDSPPPKDKSKMQRKKRLKIKK